MVRFPYNALNVKYFITKNDEISIITIKYILESEKTIGQHMNGSVNNQHENSYNKFVKLINERTFFYIYFMRLYVV